MPTLTTRDLSAADAVSMAKVAAACFDRPWSAAVSADELSTDGREYLGTFHEGDLVGFAGIADLAGEVHVMTVAVVPEHRRKGIARRLVTSLVDRARERGHAAMTLEVRARDLAARGLYEALGFAPVGTRPGYYRDDDAVIMTRTGA